MLYDLGYGTMRITAALFKFTCLACGTDLLIKLSYPLQANEKFRCGACQDDEDYRSMYEDGRLKPMIVYPGGYYAEGCGGCS